MWDWVGLGVEPPTGFAHAAVHAKSHLPYFFVPAALERYLPILCPGFFVVRKAYWWEEFTYNMY